MRQAIDRSSGFVFYPGESFNGAVARWADEASLERMLDVTRIAGVEWGHRQMAGSAEEADIRDMAAEMDVDAAELVSRAIPIIEDGAGSRRLHRFYGLTVSTALIEKRIRRVAPSALQIAPYHRALWDLRLFPCCLETGDVLIEACDNPECDGRLLGWRHTRGIDVCDHCMADLKQARTAQIDPDLVAQLRTIAQLFDGRQRPALLATLPTPIAARDGQVALDLLIRLLPVIEPNLKAFWARLHRADPFKLAYALHGAWDILAGWPEEFEAFAGQRIASRDVLHSDGNEGETMHFLLGKRMPHASPEVGALASELRERMQTDGKESEDVRRRAVAIKPAARLLCLGTSEVAQLRRDGILRIRPVIDKLGRLQPMFCRDEVETLAVGIQERTGADRIASCLGLSRQGAEQLIEWRHLPPLDHPFFLARYGTPQVARVQFEGFLRNLEEAQQRGGGHGGIPLSLAIKVIGASIKPWGELFAKLLDGSIAFRIEAGTAPLVRRIFINREHLLEISQLERPAFASDVRMSKTDAFEIMNLGPKEGSQAFAGIATGKGTRAKLLSLAEVIPLAQRHITSTEIALRRGVSIQRAYNDALGAEVPLLGPAGFCREIAEAKFLASNN